ncbi:pectate lyase [Roseimarinus sediminis]|uniref:pectate lyase n=1 Tax=Roseimarinus sediminis TaxID=1610899 RepID=UPI003D1BF494
MKDLLLKLKVVLVLTVLTLFAFAQEEQLPAFPGADGHGRFVTGGRGGVVLYVTHLNDDYTVGSLRTAIGYNGPRIIVFKVSGTIRLKAALKIKSGNLTIAGQTAPGDGITLADYPVSVDADNVIIRYMRFRMGDEAQQEADAIGGRFNKNIMIDHCSMSWSTDECVSFYQNETFTMQWCIISESLRNSVHGKGAHGYGGIWGGKNASFHHNLLAHHDSRNPRLGEVDGDKFALTDAVDLRNNVIYNWQGNSTYGGEAMNVNIVNCYYKPGPATTKKERIVAIDKETDPNKATTDIWGKYFIEGNVLTGSERATADNWTYGVYNQFHSKYGGVSAAEKEAIKVEEPHPTGYVNTHTAELAYERILQYGGASLVRDTIDKRVIHELSTGTATYMDGGNGSVKGIIDTQEAVGGWPELASTDAPADSDEDGMPDEWETSNGLDPNDGSDAQLKSVDGLYPNVEVYLNSLVSEITERQLEDSELVYIEDKTASPRAIQNHNRLKGFFNSKTNTLKIFSQQPLHQIEVYSSTGALIQSAAGNKLNRVELNVPSSGQRFLIVKASDEKQQQVTLKVAAW